MTKSLRIFCVHPSGLHQAKTPRAEIMRRSVFWASLDTHVPVGQFVSMHLFAEGLSRRQQWPQLLAACRVGFTRPPYNKRMWFYISDTYLYNTSKYIDELPPHLVLATDNGFAREGHVNPEKLAIESKEKRTGPQRNGMGRIYGFV